MIWVVTCTDGKVTAVSDLRNKNGGSSSGQSGSSSGASIAIPSPSTKYFSDPEDFYDYYYDDFLDYEEAEDYYYSHGGK